MRYYRKPNLLPNFNSRLRLSRVLLRLSRLNVLIILATQRKASRPAVPQVFTLFDFHYQKNCGQHARSFTNVEILHSVRLGRPLISTRDKDVINLSLIHKIPLAFPRDPPARERMHVKMLRDPLRSPSNDINSRTNRIDYRHRRVSNPLLQANTNTLFSPGMLFPAILTFLNDCTYKDCSSALMDG